MSLAAFAARLAAQQCLMGKTWAADQVKNSPISPIDEVMKARKQEAKPMIAVYTGDVQVEPQGRSTTMAQASADLMVFIYLPPAEILAGNAVFRPDGSGGGALLDLMERQVDAAFVASGPWPDMWRKLVISYSKVGSRPILVEAQEGTRIMAREITISLNLLPEPGHNVPLFGHWLELDALLRQNTELSPFADLIKPLIEGSADIPEWQEVQKMLALSGPAMRALGLAPMDETETGDPALLTDIDLPNEITVVAPILP